MEHLYTLILNAEIPVETAGGIDVRLNKDAATITKYYLVSLPKAIGSGAVIVAAGAIMLAIDWRIGLQDGNCTVIQDATIVLCRYRCHDTRNEIAAHQGTKKDYKPGTWQRSC